MNYTKHILKIGIVLFLALVINSLLQAQQSYYAVRQTSFSASSADDMAPVVYKNGLVYCSNAFNSAVMSIKSGDENLFNIMYVEEKDSGNWKSPALLAEKLTTIFNEGPATFSPSGDTIYYARNNEIKGKLKDINDPSNTLGIFASYYSIDGWSDAIAFPYNSKDYSLGTPSLSADGSKLYFASDMPGGFGGTDIYFCELKNGQWGNPENCGDRVNSEHNESYPFTCSSGILYFASDRPSGYGGKDIYFCKPEFYKWSPAVLLGENINSNADDYGITTDPNMEQGYFSSNRKGKTNIYKFTTTIPQFAHCSSIDPYLSCFNFTDERFTDSLHLEYEWDFGYGRKQKGVQVRQCFKNTGEHSAILTIIHHLADSVFETKSSYYFETPLPPEPFILTEGIPVVGKEIVLKTPSEKEKQISYFWEINGMPIGSGTEAKHVFESAGMQEVQLGFIFPKNESGYASKSCISLNRFLYKDIQDYAVNTLPAIVKESKMTEELDGKNPKNTSSYAIRPYLTANLPAEKADSLSSALFFMSHYPLSFDEVGAPDQETKSILDFFIEKCTQADDLHLLIAVHESKRGSDKQNLERTNNIANGIQHYYLSKGSDPSKFSCKYYGADRPIPNNEKSNSEFNRRIEFIFINETVDRLD